MLGLIGYVNDFNSKEYETLYVMTQNDTTLNLFFNCKASEVQTVIDSPGDEHLAQISFS